MFSKILFALWVLPIILSGCASAPEKPPVRIPGDYRYTREYADWLIRKEMRSADVQGLSIALVDDQQVVWAEGFGFADAAKGVAADPATVYPVGSITKLFTTLSALQLVEQERLDIDQPIEQYLPGFSIKRHDAGQEPITPRQLMTHHAGLPRDIMRGMWTARPAPFGRILELIQDEYLAYPPERLFSYSNLGMTLLGDIVQTIAKRDFSSQLESGLLHPLGMTDAYIATLSRGSSRDAKGYKKGIEVPITPLRDIPAGGLHASVNDLSRFMMMIFADGRAGGRPIVQPETLEEMLRPQNEAVALDLDFRVGLGWALSGLGQINIRNAGKVAHHNGGTPLFHSQMILLPEHKLGVVVLSNSAESGPLVERVASETLKLALEAKTGITQPTRDKPVTKDIALPEAMLQDFEGRYTTLLGAVAIRRHAGGLQAEFAGHRFELLPREDGWFGLRYELLGIIPLSLGELDQYQVRRASIAGREVLIASDGYTRLLIGERLQPHPIPRAWRQRAGRYEIVNAGQDELLIDDISLEMKDGLLLLRARILDGEISEIVLQPLSDTQALLLGPLAGAGETLEAVQHDGEELWRYSGYLFKRKVN